MVRHKPAPGKLAGVTPSEQRQLRAPSGLRTKVDDFEVTTLKNQVRVVLWSYAQSHAASDLKTFSKEQGWGIADGRLSMFHLGFNPPQRRPSSGSGVTYGHVVL